MNGVTVVVLFPLDGHPAGDSAGSPASPDAAEGDLRYHHPAPTRNQDPVLYYIHPGSETYWSPTNPGTSSAAVTTAE